MHISNFSITVVIPHHRDEQSLLLGVQSVAAQRFQPLELIIINDDDRPLSASVANRLLVITPNVRILELGRCTGSPAHPRNVGIAFSRASYVAFLDADDFWFPITWRDCPKYGDVHLMRLFMAINYVGE